MPQRRSAKIDDALLTGQQSILHADPHRSAAAAAAATRADGASLNKFVDDLLEVDDVAITFSAPDFMQHAVARLLQQHIHDAQQRVAQQRHEESNGCTDIARIDAHALQEEEEEEAAATAAAEAAAPGHPEHGEPINRGKSRRGGKRSSKFS